MEEGIISFETAKLAKEKGFQEEELHYYFNEELLQHPNRLYYNFNQDNPPLNQFSAPYQSFLQKWLREGHKIHITLQNKPFTFGFDYYIIDLNTENCVGRGDSISYEEALEKGLLESLKLIE